MACYTGPFALVAVLAASSGCATVMNGRNADVTLRSTPPDAKVTVRDHEGTVVAQTMTPGSVELRRGRGWLRPAKYSATFEKPGYATAEMPLRSKLNPWLLGNVVMGGPFGLGVDLASGALWRPQHADLNQSLLAAAPPGASPVYAAAGSVEVTDQSAVRTASATQSDTGSSISR